MDPAEKALLLALESSPEDWAVRLLIAEKMQARGAPDEAAQLISESPVPPQTPEQLQKVGNLGGHKALGQIKGYVAANPADGYGHEILGFILQHVGEEDQANKHFEVARALGAVHSQQELIDADSAPPPVEQHVESVGGNVTSPPPPNLIHPETVRPEMAAYPGGSDAEDLKPGKRTGSKATAIIVAIAVHVVIAFLAAIFVIFPPTKDEPEIVASVIGPPAAKREMQKKNVVKQVKKSTSASAAAAPVAQLMRASAMAKFSLPKVTKTSTGPLGMGEGNLGAGGFGGTGTGLGSGASFFGGTSKGNRFAFILDWSGSMKDNQVNMVIKEMDKTLNSFSAGVQYQVLLFAGGAYYAVPGWKVNAKGGGQGKAPDNTVVDPRGKSYFFPTKGGYANYDFRGSDSSLPTTDWLDVNPANIKATMSILNKKQLYGGTDWRWPFKMAMNLNPPPDVIYFMADGSGGAQPAEILSYSKRKNSTVQINMFGMETIDGAKEMEEISSQTKGDYKIILRSGKTIDGEVAIKNRGEALKRIKAGR